MINKPKVLELADRLERRRLTRWVHSTGETPRSNGYVVDVECVEAASELRRLQGEVEKLREALSDIVDFVDGPAEGKRPDVFALLIKAARAALKETK